MPHSPVAPVSLAVGPRREAPREFLCSCRRVGRDAVWVRLEGELDVATAPQVEEALLRGAASAPRLVVVDLRELVFMDSFGVRAIVEASARARAAKRRLILLRGAPQVERMFELTGTLGSVELVALDAGKLPVEALTQLVRETVEA